MNTKLIVMEKAITTASEAFQMLKIAIEELKFRQWKSRKPISRKEFILRVKSRYI